MMEEPLKYFVNKYGVDNSQIGKIVCGEKYTAVMLKNGSIGVCANLLNKVEIDIKDLESPNLNNTGHRIILNAYFNSILNYSTNYDKTADIFNIIDFSTYENIIMVGLFKSLLEKFECNNIRISVFDLRKKNLGHESPVKEMESVGKADAIILTATSIFNKTFMNIVNDTGDNCDIFLLGPTSIMTKEMFDYRNIKMIFGAIFEKKDERVLETIKNGGGTRLFLPFGKKVYL